MSLEQKIEELTGAMTALTAVMERTAANQERLLAGQEKAIEAVKAGNPATATTRSRKPKAVEAEAAEQKNDEPADTASGADDAGSASEGNSAGVDATTATTAADNSATTATGTTTSTASAAAEKLTFAVAAKKWLDKEEKGSAEYKARGGKIMGILGNFGAGKMSDISADDEDKAMFFLKRTVKGLPVTFDAAYDFSGPFDQDEPAADAPAASDEDEDMFG